MKANRKITIEGRKTRSLKKITYSISLALCVLCASVVNAQLVMTGNYQVVMSGGTQANPTSIVLTNSTPAGITNNGTGWIISENEFNLVQWNIGTGIGKYVVPFGYSTTDYIPLSLYITAPGKGMGVVKFSTYHCGTWDNRSYKPSDVTTMADFGAADYSNNMVDRFWVLDANTGYTTKPSDSIEFSFISAGAASEVALFNYIIDKSLIAQRFNSILDKWDDFTGTLRSLNIVGNIGTITSGAISPANFFRSWTLANDSNLLLGVEPIITPVGNISTYPNPATGTINIIFGQETEGDAVISIVDVTGRELIQKRQYVSRGMILPIDISALPAAMYFVRVNNDNINMVSKFIKEK